MQWNRMLIITLMLCGLLVVGCQEGVQETTPTDQATSIVDVGVVDNLKESDPITHEEYMAGIVDVMNIDDPDYWIQFQFSTRISGQTHFIDAPGWHPSSTITVKFTPPPSGIIPGPTFKVLVPANPQNYNRATVFRMEDYPEGYTAGIQVTSFSLGLPGPDSDYMVTAFTHTYDPAKNESKCFDWQFYPVEEPRDPTMGITIVDYVKPEDGSRGGWTYDPDDPPGEGD